MRGTVHERRQRAAAPADRRIHVAVAVDIEKARDGEARHRDAGEGIVGAGQRGEGAVIVAKRAQAVILAADDEVQVAVAVEIDEAGSGIGIEGKPAEHVVGSVELGEGAAVIPEDVQRPVGTSDDEIGVPVAIQVHEGGGRVIADVDTGERIGEGRPFDEGLAVTVEQSELAAVAAHDHVEVAVAIEVGEGRRRRIVDVQAAQHIVRAGQLGEGARVVAERMQEAVVVADDEVEIAVPVESREDGRGITVDADPVERTRRGERREMPHAGRAPPVPSRRHRRRR